jgi:penicillin-binding protein 1A
VLTVTKQAAVVFEKQQGVVRLEWPGLSWAAPRLDKGYVGKAPEQATEILKRGDVVYILAEGEQWRLSQLPEVEGALVSLDPEDGAIRALVGGLDYFNSKFNRATQAQRQPGSSFKPFIYSAALEKGFTPASIINDAPVVFEDKGLEATWRPENYSGEVFGPTRLREALVNSRNLVSIRLLQATGIAFTMDYIARFGFDTSTLPRDLSLALGSGTVTPLQITAGYAVFANGGFKVEPYVLDRVEAANGEVLFQAAPAKVCESCEAEQSASPQPPRRAANPKAPAVAPRVLEARNVYLMNSMMRDVITRGTGRGALALGRTDLAGKTGTTNDQHDAWFCGFNRDVVTTTWMGYDDPRPLGESETGGRTALPMWIDFMRVALDGVPEQAPERPPGLATVRIDPDTGQLTGADHPGAMFETFLAETVPDGQAAGGAGGTSGPRAGGAAPAGVAEELF